MPIPPYKKARLVNSDQPVSARWYIIFYAWNVATGRLTCKKLYTINIYKTKTERLDYARKTIKAINEYLADGYHINPKKKGLEVQQIYSDKEKDYRIGEAFTYILPLVRASKRLATYNSYNSIKTLFIGFCDAAGWTDWKIRTLSIIF